MTDAAASRAGLLARFAAGPIELDAAASAAGAGGARPPAGEWSAREIVLHLVAVEGVVWQARLDDLERAPEPRWGWTEPGVWSGPGDDTLEGALAELRRRRAVTVARIDGLDDLGWRRHGTHATYGRVDVARLLEIAIDHDAEHRRQVAALGQRDGDRGSRRSHGEAH
jgi:hypothetical protein